MANTIIQQLGNTKSTITNRKVTDHQPSSERVQIKPGTIPKTSYKG